MVEDVLLYVPKLKKISKRCIHIHTVFIFLISIHIYIYIVDMSNNSKKNKNIMSIFGGN